MNPTTIKVLERFNHEHVLMTSGIGSARRSVTLEEVLAAGLDEPRIYEALPALLIYKPMVIRRLKKDEKKYPELVGIQKTLFGAKKSDYFFGIPTTDCMKAALAFKSYLDHKKSKQKSRTMTLRLAQEDINRLQTLTLKLKTGSVSETIRFLARQHEGICF